MIVNNNSIADEARYPKFTSISHTTELKAAKDRAYNHTEWVTPKRLGREFLAQPLPCHCVGDLSGLAVSHLRRPRTSDSISKHSLVRVDCRTARKVSERIPAAILG